MVLGGDVMAVPTDRTIIYHIPKCGGTWVKVALRNAGLPYRSTRNVSNQHPFNLKKGHATPDMIPEPYKRRRYSIAFVRYPVDWYTSYWAFRSRKGARRDEKFPVAGLWSDDFDEFVNNVLDAYPGGFVTTLYQYYLGENGDKVDFIGRQEYLASDLMLALNRAREVYDAAALKATPRQNESPAKWKRRCVLTTDTLARVADCEWKVMERFYG